MIIVDISQVAISNLMVHLGPGSSLPFEEGMLRHMVLNSLRANIKKFRNEFGTDIVIACDSQNNWRKEIFPEYKGNREKSETIDWDSVFAAIENIKAELKEFFPYRVIEVDTAEGDDVIAALCHEHGVVFGNAEPILILSGDKDFQQLHSYANVKQFSPVQKKWITCKNPEMYLDEHIFRGDGSDGIPNILSDAKTFITKGARQTPLNKNKLAAMLAHLAESGTGELTGDFAEYNDRYQQNLKIINLANIPKHICEDAVKQYNEQADKPRDKIFNYLMKYKLKMLMRSVSDF